MTTTSLPRRVRAGAIVLAASAAATVALAVPALPAAAAPAAPSVTASTGGTADAPGTAVLDLPAGFRPEGVTARFGTLYVSSLADGRILALDARTGASRTLLAGVTGRALRGMQVDLRTDLLYVAGQEATATGTAGIVLAVDVRTGRLVHRWTVEGAGFLNDLVITRRSVWVTDSRVDRLARIPLGRGGHPSSGAPALLPLTGSWPVPDPAGNRANGIRALPDGTLLLDHSTAGGLWAVSPRSGEVRSVPVTGGPAITGGDGVELRGDRVWIVRGTSRTSVTELTLSRDHGSWSAEWVRDLTDPSLDVPSTAVVARGKLWAVNARFGVADPGTAAYWVTGLPLDR